jgi:hypothetical protein
MKSNQIVKFIHLLRVFISIQLLIKVARGAYIDLLIRGAKVKGQNYFAKIHLNLINLNINHLNLIH